MADIHVIVDDAIEFVRHRSTLEGINILRAYDPHIPRLYLDGKKIKQVILNLVMNAIHALDRQTAGTIKITTAVIGEPGRVHIRVADDGCGIEPANIAKLFDPFFTTKPFDYDTLVVRLEKALERSRLIQENIRLQRECRQESLFQNLVGNSPKMKRVYEAIQMIAKNDLTVLITGESGTGKDLAARAVHALSERSQRQFVAVNCPTLPENILESELFGYKKGAFTHATQDKKGLFQEAHTGSIFLDEIGDVSPTIQTKLLRVLQEKEIKPLGDSRAVQVDVRIIASTNQHLKEKIKRGEFREDFYYRLNVLPIHLPALREHAEDIPLIANHLLEKHCGKLKKPIKKLSPELLNIFKEMPWEGNVREMENLIMQGILFSSREEISPHDIGLANAPSSVRMGGRVYRDLPYREAKKQAMFHFNHAYIGSLLRACDGNVTNAAKSCGMERQALQQILRRYGIQASKYRSD